MRPQADELALPADLYRWRGVDGTTIPAYRIAVGLYHSEHDNIEERLREGVELALKLGRDVPVFWGLGNHGGGATRRDLAAIDAFVARETRVRIVHSTPDRFYEAVKDAAAAAPVVDGDLQRSLHRLLHLALAGQAAGRRGPRPARPVRGRRGRVLVAPGAEYPRAELGEAWKLHIFNDFHDILTGSCVEPAERDALDQYGRAEDIARSIALRAAASLNRGSAQRARPSRHRLQRQPVPPPRPGRIRMHGRPPAVLEREVAHAALPGRRPRGRLPGGTARIAPAVQQLAAPHLRSSTTSPGSASRGTI